MINKNINKNMGENCNSEQYKAYGKLLDKLKDIAADVNQEEIRPRAEDFIDLVLLLTSSNAAFLLPSTSEMFEGDHIFSHALNVCIISIKMGQSLKFSEERLKDMGYMALAHGVKKIETGEDLEKRTKDDEKINEILKLVDVYDAITHPPEYRHDMTPRDTLTSIVDAYDLFDREMVKVLLRELGLYPVGSYVEISTGEIGRVCRTNDGNPFRPVIILVRGDREIDLSKKRLIRITRALTKEEVEKGR